MATWLEKLRKIDERNKEHEKLAREMKHRPQADIESLRGQDPLTDWGLGVRERTLSPLSTLAGEAKRFQGLSPQEMGMEMVGGGMAGNIKKLAGKAVQKTEFELAHELAQRNAALPIEQGGLGLPVGNTAMDRAKAMGFDTTAYHGTNADIQKFNPSDKFGDKFFFAHNPKVASKYAAINYEDQNVLPVMLKTGKQKKQDISKLAIGNIDMAKNQGFESYTATDTRIPETTIMFNPQNIRSRFAAFDPFQRNSANILAGTALGGVGLSTLANYTQDEYY